MQDWLNGNDISAQRDITAVKQLYLSDSEKVRMHTGVIWPRGVNIGNRPLIEAKMKGSQGREWIVGERGMSSSRILYMTCVYGENNN